MGRVKKRGHWLVAAGITAVFIAAVAWLVWSDAAPYRFAVRLYQDPVFLRETIQEWGILAPVAFILIQALQVIVSPVPGEATGFLGGYLFGEWLGLIYSMIGLTLGSVAAFAAGRWIGEHYVRNLVSRQTWDKLGFIIEAEGAILCLVIFLIPGLPKDIACYLFGLSPMPLWVFTAVQGVGRVPGTWVLSAQGASTAAGHYWKALLITAVCLAVALPFYCYRHRIMARYGGGGRGQGSQQGAQRTFHDRLDRNKADS